MISFNLDLLSLLSEINYLHILWLIIAFLLLYSGRPTRKCLRDILAKPSDSAFDPGFEFSTFPARNESAVGYAFGASLVALLFGSLWINSSDLLNQFGPFKNALICLIPLVLLLVMFFIHVRSNSRWWRWQVADKQFATLQKKNKRKR